MPPSPDLGADSKVAIIGAGLAGSWLAFELSLRGLKPLLVDRGPSPGSAASGNPAGVVKPFVTRDASRAERFHTDAYRHLLTRLNDYGLAGDARYHPVDVVQLLQKPWPVRADLNALNSDDIIRLTGASPTAVGSASGLHFKGAGWLDPGALCQALVNASSATHRYQIDAALTPRPGTERGWALTLDGETMSDIDHVVMASGHELCSSPFAGHLPITPARGQIDRFALGETECPKCVMTGLHWALSNTDSVIAGSSYQRDDLDTSVREQDTIENRAGLEALTGHSVGRHLGSRAQIRATTPDRLPFVGPVCNAQQALQDWAELHRGRPQDSYAPPVYIDGLSVLGGFGSRGIVTSPYAACLLADWLCGDESELQAWSPELAAHRFIVREGRKGRLAAS